MRLDTLLITTWLLPWAFAAEPKVFSKKFDKQPQNLRFFDDSEVAVILEEASGTVWRSTGVGDEWETVKDIREGEALAIFKHPYDNNVAITLGSKKKHWITKDKGASWREFETDDQPSGEFPLSFHATDSDRILFNGWEECGFFSCIGKVCTECSPSRPSSTPEGDSIKLTLY